MGFYPQSAASDPQIFMTGMIELLAAYPAIIIENLCSVISGIPAKYKFLPSIAELKEECERYTTPHREREWEEYKRKRPPAYISPPENPTHTERPTMDELRAKHGENWGLKTVEQKRKGKWMDLGQIAKAYGVDIKDIQALPDARK